MSIFRDKAVATLASEEKIQAEERILVEQEKEALARDRQSLTDRRTAADQAHQTAVDALNAEEAGFAQREEDLTNASNELGAAAQQG